MSGGSCQLSDEQLAARVRQTLQQLALPTPSAAEDIHRMYQSVTKLVTERLQQELGVDLSIKRPLIEGQVGAVAQGGCSCDAAGMQWGACMHTCTRHAWAAAHAGQQGCARRPLMGTYVATADLQPASASTCRPLSPTLHAICRPPQSSPHAICNNANCCPVC